MHSLVGRISGVTLLLSLQQSSLALPTNAHSAEPQHLGTAYVIEGQTPPPCVNEICPLTVREAVPVGNTTALNKTSAAIVLGNMTGNTTGNTTILPYPQFGNSTICVNETNSNCSKEHDGPSDTGSPSNHTGSRFPGTHQTAPIRCGDGTKPPCGGKFGRGPNQSSNHSSNRTHATHLTAPTKYVGGTNHTGGKDHSDHHESTSDTSSNGPIIYDDGEKHSGGKGHPDNNTSPRFHGTHSSAARKSDHEEKHPGGKDHPHNVTSPHFPGTQQTAPARDGDKRPRGEDQSDHDASHFPGTHQTAPIQSGDGTKYSGRKHHPANASSSHFIHTHQTAPIHCGDGSGTQPPCGKDHPTNGTSPRFPGTHQTAPIRCGDGSRPPCGKASANGTSLHFPATHQTAPIHPGDGPQPAAASH